MIFVTTQNDLSGIENPDFYRQPFDYKKLKCPNGYQGPYPLKAGEYFRFFIDFGNVVNFDPNSLNVNFGASFFNFLYNKDRKRISFTVKDATHYCMDSFLGRDIILINSQLVINFINNFEYYNRDFYEKNINNIRSYFAKDRDSNIYPTPLDKINDTVNDPNKSIIPTWLKWSLGIGIVLGISIPIYNYSKILNIKGK